MNYTIDADEHPAAAIYRDHSRMMMNRDRVNGQPQQYCNKWNILPTVWTNIIGPMIADPNPDGQARMLALPLTDGFTDVALKTHVFEGIFEAIIILGGECGEPIFNEHGHIGIPSGIDLPLWAIHRWNDPFGKLNALLAALRQFMLIFMPTKGGIAGGEAGAMMEIEFFNELTRGLGRQLYDIRCTFANAQKLDKQDLRSSSWGERLIGL
jgi:hypothetical protein